MGSAVSAPWRRRSPDRGGCLLRFVGDRGVRRRDAAERRPDPRRQCRLWRPRPLRRRRIARFPDAPHRRTGAPGPAADPVPRRAGLHAFASGADDGPVFDPQRAVSRSRAGHAEHALARRLHDGRHVPRGRLRHRDFRQMASRPRPSEPSDRPRLRRVLRHPSRLVVGLGDLPRHDPSHPFLHAAA